MSDGIERLNTVKRQLWVARQPELARLEKWLLDSQAPTKIWSISGIGGIGKTTFLDQISNLVCEHGIRVLHCDGMMGYTGPLDLIEHLSAQLGMFSNVTTRTARQQIDDLSREVTGKKSVWLFDHLEAMAYLELFLRTQFIPSLPERGVLLAFASRSGLSLSWRTDPTILMRNEGFSLDYFSWSQSLEYTRRAGVESEALAQRIARDTAGYPLSLAVAVQYALQSEQEIDSVRNISANLIREVTPRLYPLVEALALMRTGTQNVLGAVVGTDISDEDFRELSELSFVRPTVRGLVVHDVARSYLLHDLKQRNPQRFSDLFRNTVVTLGRLLEETSGRHTYEVSHNLATLCIYGASPLMFPAVDVPWKLSLRPLPTCEPVLETDIPTLHNLLDHEMATGLIGISKKDDHRLLDIMLKFFPESFRIIRLTTGTPVAFATLLPLCKEALVRLPAYAKEVLDGCLGSELRLYADLPLLETDTLLSFLSCVTQAPTEYTFLDLLLALKITGWSELSQGQRCLLVSSMTAVQTFYDQLGYVHMSSVRKGNTILDVYSLDFRHRSLGSWLVHLLLDDNMHIVDQGEEIPLVSAGPSPLSQQGDSNKTAGNHEAQLTRRERQVIYLVMHGYTNKEIAAQLIISSRTVDAHLRRIFSEVGVKTRAGLAHWATRSGEFNI
ncbi:MAG: helix-turn-helix transcriptional regulator [Firmicutes bacterium]|nr:helix-turn-helix transcriptional regulator [Bacillota bacterium]